jgi:hypothetical protein
MDEVSPTLPSPKFPDEQKKPADAGLWALSGKAAI